MITTITVSGQSVSLVAAPSSLLARSADFKITDSVAVTRSPFTGAVANRFKWPGADNWTMTLTLPPLYGDDADIWEAFLSQMRGRANAAQFSDPRRRFPKGALFGSAPLVDNATSGTNGFMAESLHIKGLAPNTFGVFLPGDYIQVGYRLYRVLDRINADANGKAILPIFPTLREVPVDGSAVIVNQPKGLFALASNDRAWSGDYSRMNHISIQLEEYR
jgi:hypothetical protein